MNLFPGLQAYVDEVLSSDPPVAPDRICALDVLAGYIASRVNKDHPAQLVFICTHNSRRSHLAQIWTTVAAAYYGIPVASYSGGTEVTAFNPRAVAALRRAGFRIEVSDPRSDSSDVDNPHYLVSFSADVPAIECYSKLYDDPDNPHWDFAAVMTCDHADEHCPFIPGATRIAVRYDDPKSADGTSEETFRDDERTRQIAAEMFFVARAAFARHESKSGGK